MKIAIITNVPDANSPMFASYIQYISTSGHQALTSTRFELIPNLKEKSTFHNEIKGQKLKLQYLFVIIALFNYILYLLKFTLDKNYRVKKKDNFASTCIQDAFLTIKSMMNNIYTNVSHFIFLLKKKPDFVISLCVSSCKAAIWYKRLFGKQFSYSIYEVYPNHNTDHEKFYINKYYRTISEKESCFESKFVLSPTDDTFGRLLKLRYKINNLKIVPIFFIQNNYEFNSRFKSTEPISLYYHGMFDKQRNIPEFVRAISNFKDSPIELYIRGTGPELEAIKEAIKINKIENKVHLLEPIPIHKLIESAAKYDIGISLVSGLGPNNRFLIGFKSNDYLQAGMAQIGPDSYILGRYLRKNQLGFTYSKGNYEGFLDVLNELVNNLHVIDQYKVNAGTIKSQKANFETCRKILLSNVSS